MVWSGPVCRCVVRPGMVGFGKVWFVLVWRGSVGYAVAG